MVSLFLISYVCLPYIETLHFPELVVPTVPRKAAHNIHGNLLQLTTQNWWAEGKAAAAGNDSRLLLQAHSFTGSAVFPGLPKSSPTVFLKCSHFKNIMKGWGLNRGTESMKLCQEAALGGGGTSWAW